MSDKDILDVNLNLDLLIDRVETIENHDIFKIWTSIRKGGKTTLDALIKNAQGIIELEKKLDVWIEGQKKYNRATGETIAELKESLNEVAQNRIGWEENIEQNYRELLKKYSEHEDSTIHKSFYIGLLEKLDSPTSPSPYYACGKEKMEKMSDDEIMLFNEELMAKIHKRKVQPLEDSGGEKVEQESIEGVIADESAQVKDSLPKLSDDSKLPEPIDGTTYAVDTTKEAEPEKGKLYFCENCGNEISEVEGIIQEERVRGATREELIEEFLRDFQWYMAFDLHYKWFQWRRCVCKITPFQVRDWMLEKWQGRLK